MTNAETLFAQYHARLLRYLGRACGERDRGRDLAQEVFLRVIRADIPVEPADQPAAWLFRIARNVAFDDYRQRRRAPEHTALPPDRGAHASQETTVAVKQALATLPDLDRDVFLMREMAGLSYDEIAQVCELTPDAVRSRIHRARLQLRETLSAPIASRGASRMRQSGRPL